MNLTWLGEPSCHDAAVVGGKAANLSRLASAHLVPPGFCLTASATPHSMTEQIRLAYRILGEHCGTPEPSVAVRSSALDEDGAHASFAGQHETLLNVRGADAVCAAVQACWHSAQSERAREYRQSVGLQTDTARIAVLVQQLVPADVSAVVFSAHPMRGTSQVLVNAAWGLGESLVGGSVNPDSYVFYKDGLRPESYAVGDKLRMTIPDATGTREVPVPGTLRRQLSLSPADALTAARLAVELEKQMGWPVDVECAFAEGRLYLLQCRPITTLALAG